MKRAIYGILAAAAIVAFTAWWFSPGQVLKRRTESLLETLTLDRDSTRTSRHMKTYALNARLAGEVELETPTISEANGRFERSQLEEGFGWLCSTAKETFFKVERFTSVTVDGDEGRVTLRLDGMVELPSYRPVDGTFEVDFDWRKEKDGWRLTRASWREAR